MNQILFIEKKDLNIIKQFYFKKQKRYNFIFIFSISICIILLTYFLFSLFLNYSENKKTNLLKNKYTLLSLYSSNDNYTSIKLSNEISIIGLIEIPSIGISYPILSDTSENLLKISVCRFSGPLPNRTGNLCIAGHNYKNNLMFSKLYTLNINDFIYMTDLNNTKLEYLIYDKYTVRENDLTCTKNTDNIELTLITCNQNNKNERLVIKAKVKG